MESYFDVMAQHPNCLLAVDATDGGKWKSNFKIGYVMPAAPTGSGSFEETHGLLVKTNVEAENNYFKHTTNTLGYIETPLDLRGYSGDFTMIAKALVTKNEIAGTTRKDVFLMQGNLNYSNGSFVFFVLQATTANRYELNFYVQNSSNSTIMINYTIPNDFDWTMPHVFAVKYVATLKKFSLFIDGEIVSVFTKDTFDRFYNGVDSKNKLFYKMNNVAANAMKQYNAMFFDRALSADEIKILSDSMTGKNRGARYVPFITPKNLTANDSDSEWEIYAAHDIMSDGTDCVNPNSAEAWKAAAGLTSEVGWMTDRFTGTKWNVVLGWRRKDKKKFVVTKVTVGLCSKIPNEYGYYNWSSYRTERLEDANVSYGGDSAFSDDAAWVLQKVYGERTFDREVLQSSYDEESSGCFELQFNIGLDPAGVGLKNVGLNLLQLEGYIIG